MELNLNVLSTQAPAPVVRPVNPVKGNKTDLTKIELTWAGQEGRQVAAMLGRDFSAYCKAGEKEGAPMWNAEHTRGIVRIKHVSGRVGRFMIYAQDKGSMKNGLVTCYKERLAAFGDMLPKQEAIREAKRKAVAEVLNS